jgi:tetratricopeptide (TPR) repeat protein
MLSADERYQLLEEASELSRRWENSGVEALLSSLEASEMMAEPELGHLLALALYRGGKQREAARWTEQLGEACKHHSSRLYLRHLLLRGALLVETGDIGRGEALFTRSLAIAESFGDQLHLGLARMNIGVVSLIRCDWLSGIASFRRAFVSYHLLGRSIELAHCEHNMGMAFRELGHLTGADDCFNAALQHYTAESNLRQISVTEAERALLYYQVGDVKMAEAAASRALKIASAFGNMRQVGEALRVIGKIWQGQRRPAAARAAFERALILAQQTNTFLLKAEVYEELAILGQIELDYAAAENAATKATTLYLRLGAPIRAERLNARMGRDRVDLHA